MKQLALVAIGGMTGACLRYIISLASRSYYTGDFPFATLLINLTGCFIIGVMYTNFAQSENFNWIKPFIITGILGGFTTFSAFSFESIELFQAGKMAKAGTYILLSNSIGLLAAYVGSIIQFKP